MAGERGAKPTEVYGFVGAISTVITTAVFLVWAYTPEPWLHALGITYYPSKFWALAAPAYAIVGTILALIFYLGLNFMSTPPPTSFATIFDEQSRYCSSPVERGDETEKPIDPISDISITEVNYLMFGGIS
ncbi:phosphatidylinositol N-acetylglucosaminyltransferase subunit P-like [Wolffia australiana]